MTPENPPQTTHKTIIKNGKPTKHQARCTELELWSRIRFTGDLLSKGYKRGEIIKILNKKWNISENQGDRYLAKVKKRWIKTQKENEKHLFVQAVERKEYLYRKALAKKDIELGNKIDNDRLRLHGLLGDDRRGPSQTTTNPIQIVFNVVKDRPIKDITPANRCS